MTLLLGAFSANNVPAYSTLIKHAELNERRKTIPMTTEEFEAALKEKPTDTEVLVRTMDKPPDGYDEEIWGKFPSQLIVIAVRVPSQNHRIDDKQSWKTVFLFLSTEANGKIKLHPHFHKLWMWKCVNPRGRVDHCSRINGLGPHVLTVVCMVFCCKC